MTSELQKHEKHEVQHSGAERLQGTGQAFTPDVDIYASEDDILFAIDLPGVAKGDVKIDIDENDVLVVQARCGTTEPNKPLLRQFEVGDYYRAFQLSDEYHADKVDAKLDNGVLVVRIPRREETKPRRIQVSA